ncbi:interferon regulatory factor 2-like isoform X4 [Takifugu flavidus]|uniref:interferon regulatory factor 2-like isoform X4 n=1 Tax=Takifugu flavidus TaxID=433684 RepID=UPI0025449082|nr:interferon regulatory factor 2-like isoform X4 [Takifugu flavidus]
MPAERMRMRPWLEEQIDSCQIPGLKWVNKEKRIFQIPWMHAARHGWDLEKDAPLFMRWAIHTGKYQPGIDHPDPKTWKANFRCAMNSLPDIEEVKDKSIKKGSNAFRVYKMLSSFERSLKRGKKKPDKDGKPKRNKEVVSPERTNIDYLAEPNITDKEVSKQEPVIGCTSDSDTDSDVEDSKKDVSDVWKQDHGTSLVTVATCSLPGMATFISSGKSHFRVTSMQDPTPLISYHADTWMPTYKNLSSHTHEVRASVIMKTSDVTSS